MLDKISEQVLLTRYAGKTYVTIQVVILVAGTLAAYSAVTNGRELAGVFDVTLVVAIQLTLWIHRVMIRVLLSANQRLIGANEKLMSRMSSGQN